jgi:hypothetical protein
MRLQSRFRGTEEEKHESAAPVTYKGKEIGPPQHGCALNVLPPASRHVGQPCDTVTMHRNARTSRRWHSLPPLPPEEGAFEPSPSPEERAPEPPPKDDTLEVERAFDDLTDTEAVLKSLHPERLSLHHIKLEKSPAGANQYVAKGADAIIPDAYDSSNKKHNPRKLTARRWLDHPEEVPHHVAHGLASTDNGHSLTDSHSSHTQMRDVQVCHMGDPGVDKRNEQQKQPVKRESRDKIIRLEAQHGGTTTKENTLDVLPEEDASPESIFYTSLIDIVKAYYKEMSEVCLQPHETGQTSEDHWLREKWRQRSAMDKRLLAAERASGYKVSEPCMRSESIH